MKGTYGLNSIFTRTSVRKYKNRKVESEKITDILKAAMQAPSAGNQQPWEFYVVENPDVIDELSKSSPYAGCAKGAPLVIIPCYRTEGIRFPELNVIDASIATEHILLEAEELGLGAVWLAVEPFCDRIEKVRKAADIREDLVPLALVPVGYPAEEKKQPDRFDKNRIHFVR